VLRISSLPDKLRSKGSKEHWVHAWAVNVRRIIHWNKLI
jgi:hypothetical protein